MAEKKEERYVPVNAVKISGFFARNKAFDFADNLTVAREYDARSLFGVGGKETVNGEKREHNPPATIKCSLSDFRGDETVYVQHNLDISVFPLIEEVCRKNVGECALNGELASYIENLYCEVLNVKETVSAAYRAAAENRKDFAPCSAFSTANGITPISAGLFTDWEYQSKKLLAETYLTIDNCLSDNHDETAIISRYGNAIKAPIYLIRSSLFRGTPFADELEDEHPLDKMLSLIFSYARFGKIHGNDEALRNDEDIAKLLPMRAMIQQEEAQQPDSEEESEAVEDSAVEATSKVLNAVTQEETERKGQTLAEESQIQQLGDEAKEVLVASDQHKNISVLYNRNIAVSDSERAEYERVMDSETKKTVRKLIKSVGAVIRDVAEEDERRNLPYGELIYAEEAYRRDKKIFGDRRLPGDTPDIAVSILVDESGSMNWSGKRDAACKAAAMLYEFATGLHFPVCVSGHTTGWANEVKYNLFADFDNISNLDRYRLMKITADDCNRDGCAIERSPRHISMRDRKRSKCLS